MSSHEDPKGWEGFGRREFLFLPFHPSGMVAGWNTWEWQLCLPGRTFTSLCPALMAAGAGEMARFDPSAALGCCADMSTPHIPAQSPQIWGFILSVLLGRVQAQNQPSLQPLPGI